MDYFLTGVVIIFVLLDAITMVTADVYLHIPRGSNNRLNETSATRRNANRLFDSQNNNRGGYNVGDVLSLPADSESQQYQMKYFQSDSSGKTILHLEWTNQHGCGGNEDTNPQKQNCLLLLQYSCQPDTNPTSGQSHYFRNGANTDKPHYTKPDSVDETVEEREARRSGDISMDRGLHESWDFYDKCYTRERNKGLFTADRNLKSNNGLGYSSSVFTRQNVNGDRYGYECPEERDYYPYWQPSMWNDVVIMTDNSSMCRFYQTESFNVRPRGECLERMGWSRWSTIDECAENGGKWVMIYNYLEIDSRYSDEGSCEGASDEQRRYIWGVPHGTSDYLPKCLLQLQAPVCSPAPCSRSNHLGNGGDGQSLFYDWLLPYFPSGSTQRCLIRMRYNISTDDYNPINTDHTFNDRGSVRSPVREDPYIDIGGDSSPLRLAVDTAQYGRVFQDRSHVFLLRPRPANLEGKRILNLNVRGKRGNIVQTYPAVEYDFSPNRMEVKEEVDVVHIQWTGSNTHRNGHPGGDGQTGDDGEGLSGTDRNNFVEALSPSTSYPMLFERSRLWNSVGIEWIYHGVTGIGQMDLAVDLASAGYYRCARRADCQTHGSVVADFAVDYEDMEQMHNQLNNSPASYEGVVLSFRKGTYHYLCTRNNNFTNRSQKGTIVCK